MRLMYKCINRFISEFNISGYLSENNLFSGLEDKYLISGYKSYIGRDQKWEFFFEKAQGKIYM